MYSAIERSFQMILTSGKLAATQARTEEAAAIPGQSQTTSSHICSICNNFCSYFPFWLSTNASSRSVNSSILRNRLAISLFRWSKLLRLSASLSINVHLAALFCHDLCACFIAIYSSPSREDDDADQLRPVFDNRACMCLPCNAIIGTETRSFLAARRGLSSVAGRW